MTKTNYFQSFLMISMLLVTLSSCTSKEEKIFLKLTELINGSYHGDSWQPNNAPLGKADILLDDYTLNKSYQYYVPQTSGPYNVVYNWKGPYNEKENGKIENFKIQWDSKNEWLVIIGNWKADNGGTGTFNIRKSNEEDHINEIFILMFTDNWQVWGYKSISKSGYSEFTKIMEEFYLQSNTTLPYDQKENLEQFKDISNTTVSKEQLVTETPEFLIIEGENIWIRKEPTTGEVVMKLNTGDNCKILKKGKKETIKDKTDFWYQIEFNGKIGWVFGSQSNIKQKQNK